MKKWHDDYKKLDLLGGKISFILEDDEDMIEITYHDGMLIDVGKSLSTGLYHVTVVSSNDVIGWQHPLYELSITARADLFAGIQNAINTFRLP